MKAVGYCVVGVATVLGCSEPNPPQYPDLDTPLEPSARGDATAGNDATTGGVAEAQPPPASPPRAVKLQAGRIHRADLTRVVDAGLGRFLQHVAVEASLERGQFLGFRIVSLTPPEFWAGIDLKPGDVVTEINGMSIERPPQAYDVFTSLKTAKELVVSYSRDGQPRQLVFRIHPEFHAPRTNSPTTPTSSAAKTKGATQG